MAGPSPERDTRKQHTPNLESILNRGRDQFQGEWYLKKEFKALWILLAWVAALSFVIGTLYLALTSSILFFIIPLSVFVLIVAYFGILESL